MQEASDNILIAFCDINSVFSFNFKLLLFTEYLPYLILC